MDTPSIFIALLLSDELRFEVGFEHDLQMLMQSRYKNDFVEVSLKAVYAASDRPGKCAFSVVEELAFGGK